MSKLKYFDGTNWNIVNGQIVGDTLPIGSIIPYGSTVAPTGWLVCDGSAVSRNTYSELFATLGTSYGAGDGTTTFNLPDLKGRVPVGYNSSDTDFDFMGEYGGEKKHLLTALESGLRSHKHEGLNWQGNESGNENITLNGGGSNGYILSYSGGASTTQGRSIQTYNVSNYDAINSHNNLQPYQVVCYIIKVKQVAGLVGNVSNVQSNSTTDTYSCDYINELINMLYPVGSIVIKADNEDYSNWLGFTWERTLVGRVAVGINSSDADFDTIGETGGSKTHTQTTDEVGKHTHLLWIEKDQSGDDYGLSQDNMMWAKAKNNWANGQFGITRNDTNNPTPMNIMNPYQVVAYWKRVS